MHQLMLRGGLRFPPSSLPASTPQGLPTGLHKSPEFSRCRSESMSQRFHMGWNTLFQNFNVFPPLVLCGPSPHTHISHVYFWYSCTPGSSWCQSHLKALLSIPASALLPLPYKNGLTVLGPPSSVVFPVPCLALDAQEGSLDLHSDQLLPSVSHSLRPQKLLLGIVA